MRIAVIRRDGLGDLLCTVPLILFLQKKYPLAEITLFVSKANSELIPYLPPVNDIIVLPNKGNKYWNLYKTAWKYRRRFDLAISAKTSPMKLMNFFLYWLKSKKSIAYVDKSWHSKLVSCPLSFIPEAAKQRHQALKVLQTVAPELQEIPVEFFPKLTLNPKLKEKYGCHQQKDVVVLICATTTHASNRLHEDKYAALLNKLSLNFAFSVRIVGQKKDMNRADALAKRLKMTHSVHFPRNFEEFMVLLELSDLFFVGDGGVAHIGAALGKRVVALFGETSPIQWQPLSTLSCTLYHPIHVDQIPEKAIFKALNTTFEDLSCG